MPAGKKKKKKKAAVKKPSSDLLDEMATFRQNQVRHIKELINFRRGTGDGAEKEFVKKMIGRLTEQILEEDFIIKEFKAKKKV